MSIVCIFSQSLVPAGLDTWWQDIVTTHESSMGHGYGEPFAFGSVRRMLVYVPTLIEVNCRYKRKSNFGLNCL